MVWLSIDAGIVSAIWSILIFIGWRMNYIWRRNHFLLARNENSSV